MKFHTLIIIALILFHSSYCAADELFGEYQAFTESELVIELTVFPNNEALLLTGYYSVEPDIEDDLYKLRGKWRKSNNILKLDFEKIGKLEYQIVTFLPYSEFDAPGGSFGLRPLKVKNSIFEKYNLWKKSNLSKFMGR